MGEMNILLPPYQSVRHFAVTGVCMNIGTPPLGCHTYFSCMTYKKEKQLKYSSEKLKNIIETIDN